MLNEAKYMCRLSVYFGEGGFSTSSVQKLKILLALDIRLIWGPSVPNLVAPGSGHITHPFDAAVIALLKDLEVSHQQARARKH
jgi:hypothetical protein